MQTQVLSAGYSIQAFFLAQTLDTVRSAVADAGAFFVTPNFDVWKDFCGPCPDLFVTRVRSGYHKLLIERRNGCESNYVSCSKANRQTLIARGRGDAAAGSSTCATLGNKDGETEAAKNAIKKRSVKRGSSIKS